MAVIIEEYRRKARLRNIVHSVVLVFGIGGLMALCAYTLWGEIGIWWSLVGIGIVLIIAPRLAPEAIMKMFKARPVDPHRGREMLQIVEELSRRAQLPTVPKLYIVPSNTLNAFAVGSRNSASIAVTDALLRKLNLREVAGVLAHEVSHISNNDLWVMGLADVLSRFTRIMSTVGLFMFFLQLPLMMMGQALIPWPAILLLYFAPAISSLLQLALSRSREYDADLEGATLSGDPEGLASALNKLERYQGRMWEDIFMPGRRIPQPSVLRSHPATADRVARLRQLYRPGTERLQVPDTGTADLTTGIVPRVPRYHWSGFWY